MITARPNRSDALLIAERDGERCAGPVLIAGVVIGVGVVQLTTQGLKESGHLSLHLLMLLVLELIGPVLVSVLGMALLLPRWLERVDVAPVRAWKQGIPSAALVGALLMVMFLAASLIAGVLMTPRGEVINEMINLLRTMDLRDVIRSILRCAGFLAFLCGWCQWRAHAGLVDGHAKSYIVSNLLGEGLMIGLSLKVSWFLVAHAFASAKTLS